MRSRLTYANVAATLALVLSMSGGALAASHYLITSTKQISPKVLKKLKGNTGAAGKQGAEGAKGATGERGSQGVPGETGPSHVYYAEEQQRFSGHDTLSLKLPAGKYLLAGSGQFLKEGTLQYGSGECHFEVPGNANTSLGVRVATVPSEGEEDRSEEGGSATVPIQAAIELKEAATVTEKCAKASDSKAANVEVGYMSIAATLTGALN